MATALHGPKGHFFFGNIRDFRTDQLGFFIRCAREYGDVVPIRFGPRRAFILCHPDAIEEVLVARARDFIKSPALRLLRPLLGEGLLLSESDFWLRQRRLVQPAFHRQQVAAYGKVTTAYTERMLETWKTGEVRDVYDEMMKVTQAIVARTLFDADVGDDAHEVCEVSHQLAQDFGARLNSFRGLLPTWFPTPANLRARRSIRRIDQVVYRIIQARRASGEDRGDLLSIVLHAQDAADGTRMTDRQVRDEVMTAFMAGFETTAVALSWTWYLLSQHPEIDARLGHEVGQALGGYTPTVADLPRLALAERVVRESMRLYPPAYVMGREAVRDTEVGGMPLPRGTIIVLATNVVHRDPRWYEEPDAFRPDRWAGDLARTLPRYAYFPFGGGPRQCIGNAFAMMLAVLILATIAQRFRLALVPGQRIVPTPCVTLRPEPGPRMLIERR